MTPRFTLRQLPFSARLTLACFLMSVGIGYASAMVQLHLQHAGPGEVLPSPEAVVRHFHGSPVKTSHLLQLIEADEARPFNGTGSMSAAFTRRSDGWTKAIRERPEAEVRKEREAERQAVLAWIRGGLDAAAYQNDAFPIPAEAAAITSEFRADQSVRIKSLFTARCTRCHATDGDDEAATKYPLETLAQIQKYATPEVGGGRVSLEKLTQSTHAHLLSFSMLFMLTGVLFALTDYPGLFRVVLSPIVLVAQVADIACWWLARIDGPPGEQFARMIPFTGMVVGGGLALQIVLTLFHLFGGVGKLMILMLFAAAGYGGMVAKDKVVEPFLKAKQPPAGAVKEQPK